LNGNYLGFERNRREAMEQKMTGRERLIRALERETPDRIPTLEWVLDPMVTEQITGDTDQIDFARKKGVDGVSVSLNYRKTKIDEGHDIDEWGVTRVSTHEYPTPVGNPIKTMGDFERLTIPDPDDEYRYQSIRSALERCKEDDIAVVGRVKDVFSQPRDLMGFEDFLMSFYLEPDLLRALFEMCVEHSTCVGKNLRELGVEIVVIGDDIANNRGLLISPDMYRIMVLPYFSQLVRNLKDAGLYVIKHSDGDLSAVLEDLMNSGIDCIDPIDPLGNMDMAAVTNEWGDKVARKGNVDCVSTLVDKPVEAVWRETAGCIIDASAHPGHIISSSNSIHRGINPVNYSAFLDAAHELGTYPLDEERLRETAGK
jgi:uroporphyrinogen decarboxylase